MPSNERCLYPTALFSCRRTFEQIREAEVADQPVHDEGLLSLEEMEKRYLVRVLRETGGNKARVAKILGIDRRTL